MTTSARAATGTSPSSVNMTTRGRAATNAACSIADSLVVSVKSEITSARPSVASGVAAAIIDNSNSNSSNAGGSSTNEAPDQDSKLNILVNIGNQDNGNNSNDHDGNENGNSGSSSNQQQQQQQQETDEPSAVEPVVAPITRRGQSQVVLQGVDAPAAVGLPVGRRRRRARRRDVGDDCIANRTRARVGRHLAHRVKGVRATRSRVRAGEAYLVAGIS